MANAHNYATNITKLRGPYKKYMASRIIDNPKNKLLEIEVPASVPETFVLELGFYSLSDRVLISSLVLTSDDTEVIKTTTLQYPDTSIRKLLFIDFSNVSVNIEQGRLQLVTNFFIPEVGGYDKSKFTVTKISPSRQEVELSLLPQCITPEVLEELRMFASPQINSTWILDTFKYLCNQSQSLSTSIPTEKTPMSFDILQEFLPVSESLKLKNPNTPGYYTASIEEGVQRILNRTYNYASQSIEESLPETKRFTNEVISNIFSSSLSKALQEYTNVNDKFIFV